MKKHQFFQAACWIGLIAFSATDSQAQTAGNQVRSNGNLIHDNAVEMAAGNLIIGDYIAGDGDPKDGPKYRVAPDLIDFNIDDPVYIPPEEVKKDVKDDPKVIIIEKEVRERHFYTMVFNARTTGETATQSESNMARTVRNLKVKLRSLGISSDEVRDKFISLVPIYTADPTLRYDPEYDKELAGFDLRKEVCVTFTDYELYHRILTSAQAVGITDLEKVEHVIERY